ncbi:MAG: hypothetical protein K0U74_05015 [Alphaproteobacteria bacterium]|nr:hypothetical protein [Alphaproteobacteria bacterium]
MPRKVDFARRVGLAIRAVFMVAVVSLAGAGSAPSTEMWMAEEDLHATFGGVTVEGHYVDGRRFTERYNGDMGLVYSEGPREISGHWSVIEGSFCTIYDGDPTGGCFKVARSGENCFEFYFIARTEDQVRQRKDGKPGWTARAWVKGQRATCQEEPTV